MREFVELVIWFNQNLLLSLLIFLHCSLWTDNHYVLFFFVRSYKMYLNVVTSHHGNIHRCHEYIFITICLLFYHSSFLLKHLIRIEQTIYPLRAIQAYVFESLLYTFKVQKHTSCESSIFAKKINWKSNIHFVS